MASLAEQKSQVTHRRADKEPSPFENEAVNDSRWFPPRLLIVAYRPGMPQPQQPPPCWLQTSSAWLHLAVLHFSGPSE